jgi:phospholipid/cholesterol/gamma-HCH transport system permease protein
MQLPLVSRLKTENDLSDNLNGYLDPLKKRIISPIEEFGDIIAFFFRILQTSGQITRSWNLVINSMLEIGVKSLPIVFVISVFAGATTAWQATYQLEGFVSLRYIGTAVTKSIILELGPVLTGLVLAGRVGASIAASLGAMKITEQIDALSTMAIDPVRYLALPRVFAGMVMLPLLTVYSCVFGVLGGLFVSVNFLDISTGTFIYGMRQFFYVTDVIVSLVKAFIFGTGLCLLGCYYGFKASGGAEGVGVAAIKAFVTSAIFILFSDFIVASIAF